MSSVHNVLTHQDIVIPFDNPNKRYEKLIPVELYNNSSGTASNITLSDSLEKYDYIEIFYTNPSFNMWDSKKIDSPNGKKTSLNTSMRYDVGGSYYTYFRDISFSGNKITNLYAGYYAVRIDGSIEYFNTGNYLNITKVLGYKK